MILSRDWCFPRNRKFDEIPYLKYDGRNVFQVSAIFFASAKVNKRVPSEPISIKFPKILDINPETHAVVFL